MYVQPSQNQISDPAWLCGCMSKPSYKTRLRTLMELKKEKKRKISDKVTVALALSQAVYMLRLVWASAP